MNVIDRFKGEFDFLSNFHPAVVEWGGLLFPSVEHGYVYAKHIPGTTFTLPDDEDYITFTDFSAGKAKRYGELITLRSEWESIKLTVMEDLLRQKFSFDSALGKRLLATGDCELIEGNFHNDTFWGVCKGVGENRLGKLLMEIREDLLAHENCDPCE